MASSDSPRELECHQLIDREAFTHFVINLPRKVSDEIKWNNFIDRELFIRLAITLGRDVTQVMKAIALWIWLEEFGYPNLIEKLLQKGDQMVIVVMAEAVNCIYYIEKARVPPLDTDNIPMTHLLMNRDISLRFFYDNRYPALFGITKVMNDVCAKVFGDIVQTVLALKGLPSGEGSSRMGGVGGGDGAVQKENSEIKTNEGGSSSDESEVSSDEGSNGVGGAGEIEEGPMPPPPPPQTMGIVGGNYNVVSIWGVRDQQENSERIRDDEEGPSDESD